MNGINTPIPATNPPPAAELRAAYEIGTISDIARTYKVGRSTVRRWLVDAGIVRRAAAPRNLQHKFEQVATEINDQLTQRQQERDADWLMQGTLRWVEVFEVGAVRVTRECTGLR